MKTLCNTIKDVCQILLFLICMVVCQSCSKTSQRDNQSVVAVEEDSRPSQEELTDVAVRFLSEYRHYEPALQSHWNVYLSTVDISFNDEKKQWWVWFSSGLPGASIGVKLDELATRGTIVTLHSDLSGDQLFTLKEFKNRLPTLIKNQTFGKK